MNKDNQQIMVQPEGADHMPQHSVAGHERLKAAIRQMRADEADRLDSVTDIRVASIARLELLLEELQPVFDAVPDDDAQWDFCLGRGMRPRLWLDASAFVMIGRDLRSYQFVRDSRCGRVILAEDTDKSRIADAVTRYIAARILERQRQMDEPLTAITEPKAQQDGQKAEPAPLQTEVHKEPFWGGVFWFLMGAFLGCAALALIFRYYGIRLSLPV
ncbi:hypothetical protein [Pseudochrobactrum sp. HB0163]|uniref:hypothetical protein n=1 Tax=Pseudochrobactrum sp. HB0163 TaxID=3450708 RepID=UPI003F6DBECD